MLVLTSALIGDARGSLGSTTFKMNRTGLTVQRKSRHLPSVLFPNSLSNIWLSQANSRWRLATPAHRHLWEEAALSEISTNNLGQRRSISAYNLFMKRNLMLLAIYKPFVINPLIPSPIAEVLIYPPQMDITTGQCTQSFTDFPPSLTSVVYLSRPLSPGISHSHPNTTAIYYVDGTGVPFIYNFTSNYETVFGKWWLACLGFQIFVKLVQVHPSSGKIVASVSAYFTIISS